MQRVQKLLSNYGFCSRRKAEELIKERRVTVNNKFISIGDQASEDDVIHVDGKEVAKGKKIYIRFNKPVGCVTALNDKKFKTVMDYIKLKERVFPIGRLDYNTSGLLLLTNDGDFANRVMHPKYEIKKTYLVEIFGHINDKQISMIEKGMFIEGKRTSPAKVKKSGNLVEITIHEGRNRIVRKMLAKLGIKIKFIERIRIGQLALGDLKSREYRHLEIEEIEKIFE